MPVGGGPVRGHAARAHCMNYFYILFKRRELMSRSLLGELKYRSICRRAKQELYQGGAELLTWPRGML